MVVVSCLLYNVHGPLACCREQRGVEPERGAVEAALGRGGGAPPAAHLPGAQLPDAPLAGVRAGRAARHQPVHGRPGRSARLPPTRRPPRAGRRVQLGRGLPPLHGVRTRGPHVPHRLLRRGLGLGATRHERARAGPSAGRAERSAAQAAAGETARLREARLRPGLRQMILPFI